MPAANHAVQLAPASASQLRLPAFAADRILVTEGTLAKWRSAGVGPAYVKISGGRVAYEDHELDRYIASRRVQPSAAKVA
jgi:hypothetical protein